MPAPSWDRLIDVYLRPSSTDLRLIGYHTGSVLVVFSATGALPLMLALADREWAPFSGLVLMMGLGVLGGGLLRMLRPGRSSVDWRHGMTIVGAVWLIVPGLAAIPLALSGHYSGWLDAYFDAMSGVTTTGLSVVQDLDHLAPSLHVWRHLLQFLGGGGIVVAFLSLYPATGSILYHSEARDDRILPSAGSTARFIWRISLVYAVVGIIVLWLAGALELGFSPGRALLHSFTIFTAAYSTGGFAPMSSSVGYYHSAVFEVLTGVFMVLGATSFAIHYQAWHGSRRALLRDSEVRTYLATFAATTSLMLVGAMVAGAYTADLAGMRRVLYQALSAQTTTGFATVSVGELARWRGLAFAGIGTAMALGSMASSTGGGVKALRVAITVKAMLHEVRRYVLPPHTTFTARYVQGGTQRRIQPDLARGVMAVSLLYFALYVLGAVVGVAYGYSLDAALFESISAAGTVGLSVGITGAGMPVPLEIVYIMAMWVGRLEFIAVFAFIGYLLTLFVGD